MALLRFPTYRRASSALQKGRWLTAGGQALRATGEADSSPRPTAEADELLDEVMSPIPR